MTAATLSGPTSTAPPPAPGRLGEAIPAPALFDYLGAVTVWRDHVEDLLEHAERRASSSTDPASYTADLALAFALWQAIATRVEAAITTWDSGRVGDQERIELSRLIWGRLDSSVNSSFAVSFVEACSLIDALTGRLVARLDSDTLAAAGIGERLAALRETLTDASAAHPDAAELPAFADALEALVVDAKAGADITGAFDRLDTDARAAISRLEAVAALRRRIVELHERERAVRDVAARCLDKIADAPRLAVPSVAVLGDVPDPVHAAGDMTAFATRLEAVSRALDVAGERFAAPLAARDELRGRLLAYKDMAAARGVAEDDALAVLAQTARKTLWSAPCDLAAAAEQVGAYQNAVQAAIATRTRTGTDRSAGVADADRDDEG